LWADLGLGAIYFVLGFAPVLLSLLAAIVTSAFNASADAKALQFSMFVGAFPLVVTFTIDKRFSWRLALFYGAELALVIWQGARIAHSLLVFRHWIVGLL
jgi:hypothetical protein